MGTGVAIAENGVAFEKGTDGEDCTVTAKVSNNQIVLTVESVAGVAQGAAAKQIGTVTITLTNGMEVIIAVTVPQT